MRSREYLTPAEVENNSAHALLRASAQRQPLDQLIDRLGMPAAAAWCRDLAPGSSAAMPRSVNPFACSAQAVQILEDGVITPTILGAPAP